MLCSQELVFVSLELVLTILYLFCFDSRLKRLLKQSELWQRSRGKIAPCHTGFAFERIIRSSGMPNAVTGVAQSWDFMKPSAVWNQGGFVDIVVAFPVSSSCTRSPGV
eukprot:scaffold22581_cov123-Cylindrotheca_fusiformis.AAC.4